LPGRDQITAAGGVVWRPGTDGPELALVHRARYDDWTLPKGKCEPGESALEAAVREVGEELGCQVVVTRRLGDVRYRVGAARKTVSYWMMRYRDGEQVPSEGDEVDDVRWLSPARARRHLTYDLDRAVLARFAAAPLPESVVLLVRHAKAGKSSEWRGDDLLRPLDTSGERQAARLTGLLRHFGPTRIVTADPKRCVQTVTPAAGAFGLAVETDPRFGDEHLRPRRTTAALMGLAEPGSVTVVCSQGSTIPLVISELVPSETSTTTRKAALWVLSIAHGAVLSADYYGDAAS
jgi:8-oxo-dGTP pyrophosphatase MutT (NUDIX family)/phosphohistidine phosphatase SixA